MVMTIILILMLLVGVGLLGWLFWSKWSQLRLLDPESLPDAQTRKLKYDIMRQRVARAGGKYVKKARENVVSPLGKTVQEGIRRVAGKLTAAERSYQKKQRQTGAVHVDRETVRAMFQEAKEMVDANQWDRAEKVLIEIISTNPRDAEAYELLGRLYFQKKEYDLAQETWSFLIKLQPEDPSVLAALGEVEVIRGRLQSAQSYFQKAVDLRPNNPKYLDLLIETLLELDDTYEAQVTLDRLKEANPENAKIELYTKKIAEKQSKKTEKR